MVSVVMSRATLVPDFSFVLSSCLLHPTTYLGPLVALTITENKKQDQMRFQDHFLPERQHINYKHYLYHSRIQARQNIFQTKLFIENHSVVQLKIF